MIFGITEAVVGVGSLGAAMVVAAKAKNKFLKTKELVKDIAQLLSELNIAVEEFKSYSADGKWEKAEVDTYFDRMQSITIRGITIKEQIERF